MIAPPSHRGFTLMELLVVLAIVGLLFGLALPAMQSARETARLTSCLNNLRQITLAAHQFSSAFQRLPPGTLGYREAFPFEGNWDNPASSFYWKHAQLTSSLTLLLPYLEQSNMTGPVDRIAFNYNSLLADVVPPLAGFPAIEGLRKLAEQSVPIFNCPSDFAYDVPQYFWGSQPVTVLPDVLDAMAWVPNVNEQWDGVFATTNYLACGGAHSGGEQPLEEMRPFTGLMSSRSPVVLGRNRDGTSNTMVYGETIGWIRNHIRLGSTPWISGGLARGRGDIPWMQPYNIRDPEVQHLGDPRHASPFGFGSMHPNLVSIALADGSVRPLGRHITWSVLYAICGADDGGLVEWP